MRSPLCWARLRRRRPEALSAYSAFATPPPGIRTLDVLHVACAQALGLGTFVTCDDGQAALAKAVGLRVARP